MAMPVQPPNMTGISSATATVGGAEDIRIGGLNFSPAKKDTNDILMFGVGALTLIAIASIATRRR